MFASIFGKKKPVESPQDDSDPIPSHDATPADTDDYIFLDRKDPGPGIIPSTNIYPPNPAGIFQPNNVQRQNNQAPVPYLQGVPFKLSPELCTNDSFETTQLEVDGILALMTRQLQFNKEYDFALERGLVEQ